MFFALFSDHSTSFRRFVARPFGDAFDRLGRAFAGGCLGVLLVSAAAPAHVAAQEKQPAEVMQAGGDTQGANNDPSATMTMDEPERQNLSYTLPAGQPIDVDNPYGSVFVRFGGYEHQLDIHATIQQPKGALKFVFAPAERGGRFVVAATLPGGGDRAEGQRIDLVLYVPEKHPLSVRTVDGGIESRGLKSDVTLKTDSGNISGRGNEGAIQAESADGRIRFVLGTAPLGSTQRFATRTGDIILGVTDALDADVRMATSAMLATDYSVAIEHRDREEPNKRARATVGAAKTGKDNAVVVMESLRGNLQLSRRAVFLEAGDAD